MKGKFIKPHSLGLVCLPHVVLGGTICPKFLVYYTDIDIIHSSPRHDQLVLLYRYGCKDTINAINLSQPKVWLMLSLSAKLRFTHNDFLSWVPTPPLSSVNLVGPQIDWAAIQIRLSEKLSSPKHKQNVPVTNDVETLNFWFMSR